MMPAIAISHPNTGTKERHGQAVYLLIALAYVVSGKLGLMLAQPPGYASPIFLPAGIAVAAALIGGGRALPWVFLASLALNVWVGFSTDQHFDAMDLLAASVVAAASTAQAAVAGWVLRRVLGYPLALDHSGQIMRFLLLTPLLCLTSASLSVSGLFALGLVTANAFGPNWAAWWVGDTLGVLVMLPLSMIAFGEPRPLWRSRVWTVALPMLLVFALVVIAFLRASQWEYSESLSEFRQLSQQSVDQVQAKLEEQAALLEQTAGLFASQGRGQVTRGEFHTFAQKSLHRFPMIQAFDWAPQVDAAHRAGFEAAQREAYPGFEIRERNAAGQFQRARDRSLFYPITYVEPLVGNEPAVGFDIGSDAKRLEAMIKGRESGAVTITAPVRLAQESQEQQGLLLVLAINPEDMKYGFALIAIRAGDFMDKLVKSARPMLYTRLIDLDDRNALYDNFAPEAAEAVFTRTFEFGTRRYRMETAPTPAYFMQHRGWQSWGVLAAGILGTGLMGSLLMLGTGYTARITTEVRDRTAELKEREEGLKEAQQIGRIGNWGWDAATGAVTWSEESYRIFGLDPHRPAPTYEDHLRLYTPDSAARLDAAVKQAVETGEPYELDLELAYAGGASRWVTARSRIWRDAGGKVIGLGGTVQDITQRKEAEQILALYAELVRQMAEGMVLVRASDGAIILVNPAFERMFGYAPGELNGRQVSIVNAPTEKSPEQTAAEIMDTLRKTGLWNGEVANIKKDGARFWSLANVSTFVHPQHGEVWLSIHQDITERKRIEEALRRSSEEIEDLYEQAPCGYHSLDENGLVVRMNHTELEWLGYGREEVVGKMRMSDLFTPESVHIFQENFPRFTETGFVHDLEFELKRKDGTRFPVLANATAIRDSAGRYVSSRSTVFDLTERKKLEHELQRQARIDMLTGLNNRRHFFELCEPQLARSRRHGEALSVLMLDLDNFKSVNDTYGHHVGDASLQKLSEVCLHTLREIDIVGRLGGEEFAALLPETDAREALEVAERLRLAVEHAAVELEDGASLRFTVSIGVSSFDVTDARIDSMLKRADTALYEAKRSGRNRVCRA